MGPPRCPMMSCLQSWHPIPKARLCTMPAHLGSKGAKSIVCVVQACAAGMARQEGHAAQPLAGVACALGGAREAMKSKSSSGDAGQPCARQVYGVALPRRCPGAAQDGVAWAPTRIDGVGREGQLGGIRAQARQPRAVAGGAALDCGNGRGRGELSSAKQGADSQQLCSSQLQTHGAWSLLT